MRLLTILRYLNNLKVLQFKTVLDSKRLKASSWDFHRKIPTEDLNYEHGQSFCWFFKKQKSLANCSIQSLEQGKSTS